MSPSIIHRPGQLPSPRPTTSGYRSPRTYLRALRPSKATLRKPPLLKASLKKRRSHSLSHRHKSVPSTPSFTGTRSSPSRLGSTKSAERSGHQTSSVKSQPWSPPPLRRLATKTPIPSGTSCVLAFFDSFVDFLTPLCLLFEFVSFTEVTISGSNKKRSAETMQVDEEDATTTRLHPRRRQMICACPRWLSCGKQPTCS